MSYDRKHKFMAALLAFLVASLEPSIAAADSAAISNHGLRYWISQFFTQNENPSIQKVDLSICQAPFSANTVTAPNSCIYPSQVLVDIYNTYDSVNNVGVLPNKGIVTITHAIAFKDKTDNYAIYLAQFNPFDDGTISSCHACSATLALAIYQYHNGWKLFAKAPQVAEMGSSGQALTGSGINKAKDVEVVSLGSEKLYLLLRDTDGGQGYISEDIKFIRVSASGDPSVQPEISYLGDLEAAKENCSEDNDKSNDWTTSDITVSETEGVATVSLKKNFRERCKDTSTYPDLTLSPIILSSSEHYEYDGSSKKFIQNGTALALKETSAAIDSPAQTTSPPSLPVQAQQTNQLNFALNCATTLESYKVFALSNGTSLIAYFDKNGYAADFSFISPSRVEKDFRYVFKASNSFLTDGNISEPSDVSLDRNSLMLSVKTAFGDQVYKCEKNADLTTASSEYDDLIKRTKAINDKKMEDQQNSHQKLLDERKL